MYPRMMRIRQMFDRPRVDDPAAQVAQELEKLRLGDVIRPGHTVALTAGSRGIAGIPTILKAAVDHLRRLGASPFIVPAMGSHGEATAHGQQELLESYGVSEKAVGAPVRASMDVVSLGATAEGFPVYLDRIASEADHIGVIGRIKPHTGYQGRIESGLLKMIMIGLGKHVGALAAHRILLEHPYEQVVRSVARTVLAKAPVAFGLAIVENAYDDTAILEGIRPDQFEAREEQLLVEAKRLMARLPLREADLLIVDQIGKNISGSGMDTNVVGRKRAMRFQQSSEDQPQMRLIFVRDLHEKTHGNAAGIGLADFTTSRLVREMNYRATVINCLTAGYPEGAFLPVHLDSDREVIDAALKIIGTRAPEEARIIRIRHTLAVDEVEISEPCLGEPRRTEFQVVSQVAEMAFTADHNLPPL